MNKDAVTALLTPKHKTQRFQRCLEVTICNRSLAAQHFLIGAYERSFAGHVTFPNGKSAAQGPAPERVVFALTAQTVHEHELAHRPAHRLDRVRLDAALVV
jgi:hypothetical protein